MGLESVERLLAETIGLEARTVGKAVLLAAIQTRMAGLGITDFDAYATQLSRSETALADLVEDLVIPESWFFRDRQPFVRLQQLARGLPAERSLRMLSIPCASGEEPYSIAIALHEAGRPRSHIDAVDISQRLLDRALRGVFSANSFRGPAPFDLRPYFAESPPGRTVAPAIQSMVRFQRGNLLDERLVADRLPYDAIFCRNLLIYLTDAARRKALAALERLLHPDGLLFVGHAEALTVQPAFAPDGDHRSFAFRRGARTAAEKPLSRAPKGRGLASPPTPRSQQQVPPYRPPTPAPRMRKSAVRGPAANPLEQAAILADQQQHAEAARLCEQAIRDQGPSARAFKLLGVIGLATGEIARAEANLLKAVYLDRQEEEALLALALLARRRGEEAAAERFHRRAERVRQAKEGT
jgi:chemotaxis protein methyltransferase WspC